MARKVYLMSGHTSTGELKDIDVMALNETYSTSLLVLNLSYDDKEKYLAKRDFFREYFKSIGAEAFFLERGNSEEWINNGFQRVNSLYLPGGDTKTLIKNIKDMGLVSRIKSFDGIISGNSAGAYVMCPDYLRIGRGEPEVVPAFGLVDFWTKAHYEPKFDLDLKQLSEDRIIYGLENGSAIIWDGNPKFIGNIWKFSKGKKERVN